MIAWSAQAVAGGDDALVFPACGAVVGLTLRFRQSSTWRVLMDGVGERQKNSTDRLT